MDAPARGGKERDPSPSLQEHKCQRQARSGRRACAWLLFQLISDVEDSARAGRGRFRGNIGLVSANLTQAAVSPAQLPQAMDQ